MTTKYQQMNNDIMRTRWYSIYLLIPFLTFQMCSFCLLWKARIQMYSGFGSSRVRSASCNKYRWWQRCASKILTTSSYAKFPDFVRLLSRTGKEPLQPLEAVRFICSVWPRSPSYLMTLLLWPSIATKFFIYFLYFTRVNTRFGPIGAIFRWILSFLRS
jgi:hypothetical protein